MTWGSLKAVCAVPPANIDTPSNEQKEGDNDSDNERESGGDGGSGRANGTFEPDEMILSTPEKSSGNMSKTQTPLPGTQCTQLSTALICAVGALQRMTVKVPDKSNWRNVVLNSIILILSNLQIVVLPNEEEDMTENVRTVNFILQYLIIFI